MISIEDASTKLNISKRRLQKLCEEGRIAGASKISNVWILPDKIEKPLDARNLKNKLSPGEYTLSELCNDLGISVATGKNWIKLNKLKPSVGNGTIYFTKKYVNELKKVIEISDNNVLKSRRNKRYVSGSSLYKKYVSNDSNNLKTVSRVITYIADHKIAIDKSLIDSIVYECAIQLLLKKNGHENTPNSLLNFINGETTICGYEYLFKNIISLKEKFKKIISSNSELFNFEYEYEPNNDILGLIYISLTNIGERKSKGMYYTPSNVVRQLVCDLFDKQISKSSRILDPCCGTGNFLLNMPDNISFEQLYAFDIDEASVNITKLNMAIKYNIKDEKLLDEHICSKNYLLYNRENCFDYVLGNPPWGYEYTKEDKKKYAEMFESISGKSVESYDMFIEKTYSVIKNNGMFSFVLPEAVLNVKSHESIRKCIISQSDIKSIRYIGNIFDGVLCPSIIVKIEKTGQELTTKGTRVAINDKDFVIATNRYIDEKEFNFLQSDDEASLINKIKGQEDIVYLKGNSEFALGIVTGDNKKYILGEKNHNEEAILKGKNIYKFKIKPEECYINYTPEKFQQVAPTKLYRANEKLLYRFISDNLVFAYDNQQMLTLNSCNILIPNIKDVNILYILGVLNSNVMQFYYDVCFNSVKILRSHIESLPIAKVDCESQNNIISIVNNIIYCNDKKTKQANYIKLNDEIYKMYGLNKKEIEMIESKCKEKNRFMDD